MLNIYIYKKYTDPKTKSYSIVSEAVKDTLIQNLIRNLLQHFVDAGRVQEEEADVITNEYTRYIDEVLAKDKSKYSDFQSSPNSERDTDRIDVLLSSNKAFSKLWQVVKHEQAAVERGFTVNEQVEAENLDTSTVAAKCLICDHMCVIGGLMNVDIHNKQLHVSVPQHGRDVLLTLMIRKR